MLTSVPGSSSGALCPRIDLAAAAAQGHGAAAATAALRLRSGRSSGSAALPLGRVCFARGRGGGGGLRLAGRGVPQLRSAPSWPTRPLSPLDEHTTGGGSLRCPGKPSGGLRPGRGRKELRPSLTQPVLAPSRPPTPGGEVGKLVPPAWRQPKAEEREPGAELPELGGAEAGGVPPRRGPAGTNSRRGGSAARVARGGSSFRRRSIRFYRSNKPLMESTHSMPVFLGSR